jgi:hypothetical protein
MAAIGNNTTCDNVNQLNLRSLNSAFSPALPLFLPAAQPLVHNACALLESAAQLLQLPQQHPDRSQHHTSKTPGKLDNDDTSTATSTDQHLQRDQQQFAALAKQINKLNLKDDPNAATAKQPLPGQSGSDEGLLRVAQRMQEIGEALLAKAEPRLAQLRCCPLSEVQGFSQHQLVESVQEAHEALAAAQQAAQQLW